MKYEIHSHELNSAMLLSRFSNKSFIPQFPSTKTFKLCNEPIYVCF